MKLHLKIYFFLALGFTNVAGAQNNSLAQGDSLFFAKKYTEAYRVYDSIYSAGQASPSMLLKMAFIQEGLGEYTSAIVLLNQHYRFTNERQSLIRLRTLAAEHNLSGYEYTDREYFQFFLRKYRVYIQLGLCLILGLLVIDVARKTRMKRKPYLSLILQVPLLLLFLGSSYNWLDRRTAIISDSAILMSQPSAAAEPVDTVREGHLVKVMSSEEAWTKIRWEGQVAYIRTSKVKAI